MEAMGPFFFWKKRFLAVGDCDGLFLEKGLGMGILGTFIFLSSSIFYFFFSPNILNGLMMDGWMDRLIGSSSSSFEVV